MNKEERFACLEKNLKDFEAAKLESVKANGKPLALDNFEFFCMCYMPIVEHIKNDYKLTKKDYKKLEQLDKEKRRIDDMPYIYNDFDFKTGTSEIKKCNFPESDK